MKVKYEYLLYTWGGFYNKEYQEKHKEKSGYHYFDTEKDRSEYLNKLRLIEEKLNARILIADPTEGYNTRTITTLHRVIIWKGIEYYSEYELSPNYEFNVAEYHMEYKWYLGCNDYPLGEDFDYENNKVEIVQEWITGAFDIKDD